MHKPRVVLASALAVLLTATPLAARAASRPDAGTPDFGAFLAGQFAMSQSDPAAAAPAYLRALAADPTNRAMVREGFLTCLLAGRPEALRLARQLPDNELAQLLLAGEAAHTGHWDQAVQRFGALSGQGFGVLLRPLLLAWAELGDHHPKRALATLRPFATGQNAPGLYALHAAMIADIAGDKAAAGQFYRIAQAHLGTPSMTVAQALASWQARQGDKVAALATLANLARAEPAFSIALPAMARDVNARPTNSAIEGLAQSYVALSVAPGEQESPLLALAMLRLALDIDPSFLAARFQASLLLADQGHPGQALAILGKVDPKDPLAALIGLHVAALKAVLGQNTQAMADLRSLAAAHPDSPLPEQQLGDMLLDQHHDKQAVTAYDAAIARLVPPAPQSWELYYSRGIAKDRAGDWPGAEADFRHALQLSPDQPAVLNYLGYSLADRNQDLPQAAKMIERAVAARPQEGAIIDSLGWVRLRQGDIAGAVRALEHAVQLDPADPEINMHLGVAYWQDGRKLEAIYQWHRALNFGPSPRVAKKLQALLHKDTLASPAAMQVMR